MEQSLRLRLRLLGDKTPGYMGYSHGEHRG